MSSEGLIFFCASISLVVAASKAQTGKTTTTDGTDNDETTTEVFGSGKSLSRNDSEYSLGLNREPFVIPLGKPCFYSWPTILVGMVKEESVKLVLLSALLVFLLRKK